MTCGANTRTCTASDGNRVYYDVEGQGSPLLLLHGGFVHDRRMWRDAGYVAALSAQFRLILPDLRGHGLSARLRDAHAYAIDRVLNDLRAVLATEGVERVLVWGYSFGAIVGLRLSLVHPQTAGLVLLGGAFGPALPEPMRQAVLERLNEVERAPSEERALALSAEEQTFIARADLGVVRAAYTAIADWPQVMPEHVPCATAFVTGSENPWSVASLQAYAPAMAAAGIASTLLPGLSHEQELSEQHTVLRILGPFLQKYAASSG